MTRYNLNGNGYQGWIEIEIGEDTCSGKMQYETTPSGTPNPNNDVVDLTNGTVDRSVPRSTVIQFDFGKQHYQGWLSEGSEMIGGYLTDGSYQIGWCATKA